MPDFYERMAGRWLNDAIQEILVAIMTAQKAMKKKPFGGAYLDEDAFVSAGAHVLNACDSLEQAGLTTKNKGLKAKTTKIRGELLKFVKSEHDVPLWIKETAGFGKEIEELLHNIS